MAVTACFVTRNHAETLRRAIRSVAGLANEIVVVDTGSTDDTLLVAAEASARVVPFVWADDFAAACNAAVAAATGDWILWINPDEELERVGLPLLTAAAADPGLFAWRVRVRQETHADRPGHGTLGWEYRLFRRDPAVQYIGRLHPEFVTTLGDLAASRGLSVASAEAVIRRHAYLSTPTADRMRWVIRLLEAELRDRPGQVGYMIELGRNYLWLNDPRGHEVLAHAAEAVNRLAEASVPPSPWVGSLIEYLLSVSPHFSRTLVTRETARAWAARWFGRTPPVVWAVAGERYAAKDYWAALPLLESLVQMGRTGEYIAGHGFSTDIIGPAAIQNLGLCYLQLSRWDDARTCFTQLFNHPVQDGPARQGANLALLQQRPAD